MHTPDLTYNFIDILKQSIKKLHLIAAKGKFGEKLSDIEERLSVSDIHPRIMLFGIYNAGKSTLINALIGKEEAKVADVPMTYAIDEYKWQDYILYDTPGIDAPIEHESVSIEHRNKCDVIIFVMSTNGTFDTEKNYTQMIEIIKQEKRLIIVLNNKSGLKAEAHQAEIMQIKAKIFENLRNAAKNLALEKLIQSYDVFLVNAKTALKGKLEQKAKLVEISGILSLEDEIRNQIAHTHSVYILKQLVNKNINPYIDRLIQYFQKKLVDTTQKSIESFLTKVYEKIKLILHKITSYIYRRADGLDDALYQHMISQSTSKNNIIPDFAQKINDELYDQLEELKRTIGSDWTELARLVEQEKGIKLGDLGSIFDKDETNGVISPNFQEPTYKYQSDDLDDEDSILDSSHSQSSAGRDMLLQQGVSSLINILPLPQQHPMLEPILFIWHLFSDKKAKEEEAAYQKRQQALDRENEKRRQAAEQEAAWKNALYTQCREVVREMIATVIRDSQTKIKNCRLEIEQIVQDRCERINQQYDSELQQVLKNIARIRDEINTASLSMSI